MNQHAATAILSNRACLAYCVSLIRE